MILVGIADDYRFVGPAQDALDAAMLYRTRVAAAGRAFQTSKSCIFSHDQDALDSIRTNPLAAEIIATNLQGGIKSPETGLWHPQGPRLRHHLRDQEHRYALPVGHLRHLS